MTKKTIFYLTIILAATLFAGCGSDSNGNGDSAPIEDDDVMWTAKVTGTYDDTITAWDRNMNGTCAKTIRTLELDAGYLKSYDDGTQINLSITLDKEVENTLEGSAIDVRAEFGNLSISQPDKIYTLGDNNSDTYFNVTYDKYEREDWANMAASGQFDGVIVNKDDATDTLKIEGSFGFKCRHS